MQDGRMHRFARTEDETTFGKARDRIFVAAFEYGARLDHHHRRNEDGAAGRRFNLGAGAPGHFGRKRYPL